MPDDIKGFGQEVGIGIVRGLTREGLIAAFIQGVKGYFSKAKHPSLDELRDVCRILDNYRPKYDNAAHRYKFPDNKRGFKREDKTAEQIANHWFRTDSEIWKRQIQPSVGVKWIGWMPNVNPYFYKASEELDYDNHRIEAGLRHPIFRKAHSFIMTGKINKRTMEKELKEANENCEDFVGVVLGLFLDGWKEFVMDGFTTFSEGTVLRVRDRDYSQAYARGYFTITDRAPFFDGEVRHKDVGLSRRMLITEYGDNIEVTNVGAIEMDGQKTDDDALITDWLKEFEVLDKTK